MSDPAARRERRTALDIDPTEFRRLGHRLVDRIADKLGRLADGPVTPGERPSEVRARVGVEAPVPEAGTAAATVLDEAADLLLEHSLYNAHPRFFGYITAGAAPIGILGDLLASGVNPNLGAWTLSPVATEIELQTVRWIAEMIGFPTTCGGVLVSGGNVANFVAFLAARTRQAGAQVRQRGLASGEAARLRAYASEETHTWLQKAADLFGLGTDAVRWIPTDDDLRMRVDALREAIAADRAAGASPFLVVGTGGSVSTGAVDPLPDIAAVCRDSGLWFHVDGAYGGLAAIVPDADPRLAGIAEADSVAVDPHKWLYAPLEAGCTLVRDPEALTQAFSYHPPYYHFGEEAVNLVDYGLQNSRGFRALKVWLQIRQAGRLGYRDAIAEDIRLARRMYEGAAAHPEIEAYTRDLSIATFRYVPSDLRASVGQEETEAHLDALNRELLVRLERGGEAFVSNAVIRGRFVLRGCIVNFRTTEADVDRLVEIVVRLGREVDRSLRPGPVA